MKSVEYLLVEDVEKLRKKLNNPERYIHKYWKWFINVAENSPEEYHWYHPLIYLVTKDEKFAEYSKNTFLKFIDELPNRDFTMEIQFHHWCNAGAIAQYAIFYDWIADSPAISQSERNKIESGLVDYTFKHLMPSIQTKIEKSCDNQILSLIMCSLILGYLFGFKRKKYTSCQVLFNDAMRRLKIALGYIQTGGYSYEGTTYMNSVFIPALILISSFVKQVTGEDYFEKRFPPNNNTIKDVLNMCGKLFTSSGLDLPWDHYGYERFSGYSSIVYYGKKTGKDNYIYLLDKFKNWVDEPYYLWGYTDKIWTLLWWPDEEPVSKTSHFEPWAIQNIGGALVSDDNKLYLFQMWDKCGSNMTARAQVNPNSLVIEAYGSPISLDGYVEHNCKEFNYKNTWCSYKFRTGKLERTSFGYGTAGGHNVIIVDNDDGFFPGEEKEGKLLDFVSFKGFKLVSGDVTDFYSKKYSARKVIRTSFMLDERFFVITDAIDFKDAHRCKWRIYLRPGAFIEGKNVKSITSEGVNTYLSGAERYKISIKNIDGYPLIPEGRSTRIDFEKTGKKIDFAFLLYPDTISEDILDISDGWEFNADGYKVNIPIDEPWTVYGVPSSIKTGWYKKKIDRKYFKNKRRVYLHLGIFYTDNNKRRWDEVMEYGGIKGEFKIWINENLVSTLSTSYILRSRIDITRYVSFNKDNFIAVKATLGGNLGYRHEKWAMFYGKIFLAAEKNAEKIPEIKRINNNLMNIGSRFLIHNNFSHRKIQILDYSTDAVHGIVSSEREFTLVNAMYFKKKDKFIFDSENPMSIKVDGDTLYINDIKSPSQMKLKLASIDVWIYTSEIPDVKVIGNGKLRICYGETEKVYDGTRINEDELIRKSESKDHIIRRESYIDMGFCMEDKTFKALLSVLNDPDWKIQMASVIGLGERRDKRAVQSLLDLMENEKPELIYGQKEVINWPGGSGSILTQKEMPSEINPAFARRWRLKMEICIALGKIRDNSAVPYLCKILDEEVDDYNVKANAAKALGLIGDRKAVPSLKNATEYYEYNTSQNAKLALERLL